MKFLIRDDDPCAFTQPDELERCYEGIWGHVPVNFSVTPFRIPGENKGVPDHLWGSSEIMPLEQNSELVAYLKDKVANGLAEIALHGYHHTRPNGVPEYVAETDLRRKTREGKEYLEAQLDCRVTSFVPPNNKIAREGLLSVIDAGLNLVRISSLMRSSLRPIRFQNFVKYAHVKPYELLGHRYPFVLDFGDHKEVNYCSVTPSSELDSVLKIFDLCARVNGVFIFAVHYHAFEKKMKSGQTVREALDIVLERAARVDDVEYCGYERLWATSP